MNRGSTGWKSDVLAEYDPSELTPHVQRHYELQARLYTLAMVRFLGIESAEEYDEKFGGYLYIFLRGVADPSENTSGVYSARPPWDDIVAFERAMVSDARFERRGLS
mgnify:CR=1 FL=1